MSGEEFNADTLSFWFWRLTPAWGSSLTWKTRLCSNVCSPPICSSSLTHGTHARRARTHAGHARTGTFPPPFCLFPRPRLQAALGYVMHADLTGHPSCAGRPALLLGKGAPSLVLTAQEREANSQQPLFAGMVGKLPAPTWSPSESSGVPCSPLVSLALQGIFNKLFEGSFKPPFPQLEEKHAPPTLLSGGGWDSELF